MFDDRNELGAVRVPEASRAHGTRRLGAALLISAGYYVGVHVGISLTFAPSPVSTLWPPNAILLAGLLLTPWRTWWLTLACVLPAHFAAEIPLGVPWTMAAFWYLSNVSEALIGATLLVGILGHTPRFDRVRDLALFLGAGVFLAPVLSSFLDTAFVALVGWRYTGFWEVWRTRLFSNALATLTVVPLVGIWYQAGGELVRRATVVQALEATALLGGLSIAAALVFLREYSPGLEGLMYVPLPFLIWAAIRFGVSGVSLCAAVVALFAIIGALRGKGPFAPTAPETLAFTVQVFLILTESSLLLLAASLAELRMARKAAARQEQKLNLALDAAEGGTWEWNSATDRITWMAARQVGTGAAHQVRSRRLPRLLRLVHENDRATVAQALDDMLANAASQEVEFRFLSGPGKYRWITSKGRVLTDGKGKPHHIIGVYFDITQRKQHEMQTRAQQEQLAHLSRVSTLGELSGAIAHELNQPLNAILLNAQAALREMGGPAPSLKQLVEILDDIVSEDRRASEVIHRLRALLLRGRVERAEVDVNECILEVLRLERADLAARQVTVDLQLGGRIPPVVADRVQLQQVVLNLVVNARDAMANGAAERKLRISSTADGDYIAVEVRDTGHGIANPEAIFEPFFSTKEHGIGMGLAICRSIVSAYDGRLWASNNPGQGATFHVLLPAARTAEAPNASAAR